MDAAPAAMPVKPNTPATIEMMKKIKAHLSMAVSHMAMPPVSNRHSGCRGQFSAGPGDR